MDKKFRDLGAYVRSLTVGNVVSLPEFKEYWHKTPHIPIGPNKLLYAHQGYQVILQEQDGKYYVKWIQK